MIIARAKSSPRKSPRGRRNLWFISMTKIAGRIHPPEKKSNQCELSPWPIMWIASLVVPPPCDYHLSFG